MKYKVSIEAQNDIEKYGFILLKPDPLNKPIGITTCFLMKLNLFQKIQSQEKTITMYKKDITVPK